MQRNDDMRKSWRFGLIVLLVGILWFTVPARASLVASACLAAGGMVLLLTRPISRGAYDKALEDCLELLRLDPRCAGAYAELKKERGWGWE